MRLGFSLVLRSACGGDVPQSLGLLTAVGAFDVLDGRGSQSGPINLDAEAQLSGLSVLFPKPLVFTGLAACSGPPVSAS